MWRGKCAARPPPHPPPFEISASQSGCGRNFLITLPSAFVSLFQFHMVWRRWRDRIAYGGIGEGGMILNSVRAKSAKVCPEAHFPFVRSFRRCLSSHTEHSSLSQVSQWRRRRRDQPTHIDITLLFPKAPAACLLRSSSAPFLSFSTVWHNWPFVVPQFSPRRGRRENC